MSYFAEAHKEAHAPHRLAVAVGRALVVLSAVAGVSALLMVVAKTPMEREAPPQLRLGSPLDPEAVADALGTTEVYEAVKEEAQSKTTEELLAEIRASAQNIQEVLQTHEQEMPHNDDAASPER